ncbi:Epsin-1, required for endocytosis and actin patch assembly [Phytophthora pseudosyringae]|uniref:Epsin-1, required for endocytosis and actin patch assembly n=1 Tax=Phytophthora pseudosyringae TaxID=221518 RepID=A0A8T1VNN5_9STRA|nr:Epsin-1, required for endocytosis and actin patch assembly [Phytophthora pseudosyringae]
MATLLADIVIASVLLAAIVQGGFVDLYKDANYKTFLGRTDNVQVDVCYNLVCEPLDNAATSIKWGDLPETAFEAGDSMISFYVDRDCQGHDIWWRVKTQSSDDLDFPSNFRLDGINDVVSSFMVWNTKKFHKYVLLCSITAQLESASVPNWTAAAL